MEKMQILFPEPVLRRLRAMATEQDRPVSELVRRAVDRMLDQAPAPRTRKAPTFPTFNGGAVLISAADLKQALYEDDAT